MAQWPTDLDPYQLIVFQPSEMPDQVGHLTDYRDASVIPGPPLDIAVLPLPAQFEDQSSHVWDKTKGISNATMSHLVEHLTPATASLVTDGLGVHLDPNFFYTYQYSDPRSFTYSVNMIPNNAGEAENIKKIVLMFKKYSSPERGKFVKNYHWAITPANSAIVDMTKFDKKAWALTSVSTNYTGSGSSLFFEDGNPKQINLSLVFQEMETLYSDEW